MKKVASSMLTRHHKKGDIFPVASGKPILTRRVSQGRGSAHRNVMELENVWLILCVFLP
jgi:hypothetical protein